MNKEEYYNQVKTEMGDNFIGVDELKKLETLKLSIPDSVPDIPFTFEEIKQKKKDYLLILGISHLKNGELVNINNMMNIFGKDPSVGEPCFYNQDWYLKEDFINIPIQDRWYLIRKDVYDDSRAVQPSQLIQKYTFPSAVTCTYSFFITWLLRGEKLWYHDFVWCSDVDHNGDRIYVGKYNDVDGINKNGFSIHRHLGLRQCYGCVD